MALTAAQTAFTYLGAASVASAVLAVTRRNPVHSVLWVLALFLHVAGLYLLLGAQFLAAVQVIVYAGAILVFYLFVLMLLDLSQETKRARFGAHWPLGAAAALAVAVLLWRALPSGALGPALGGPLGTLASLGAALYGPFVLPFEIVSLVLLSAIVGAVVLARRRAG